jgi:hypothetical protein
MLLFARPRASPPKLLACLAPLVASSAGGDLNAPYSGRSLPWAAQTSRVSLPFAGCFVCIGWSLSNARCLTFRVTAGHRTRSSPVRDAFIEISRSHRALDTCSIPLFPTYCVCFGISRLADECCAFVTSLELHSLSGIRPLHSTATFTTERSSIKRTTWIYPQFDFALPLSSYHILARFSHISEEHRVSYTF